jgi:hypothetical protein
MKRSLSCPYSTTSIQILKYITLNREMDPFAACHDIEGDGKTDSDPNASADERLNPELAAEGTPTQVRTILTSNVVHDANQRSRPPSGQPTTNKPQQQNPSSRYYSFLQSLNGMIQNLPFKQLESWDSTVDFGTHACRNILVVRSSVKPTRS